jgi:hypothetical protein
MLTTATVYTFLFIHIGVILVVTAYYVFGAAVAPGLTERARVRFARRPWLPMLVGLVLSVPWVVVALVLLNADVGAAKFAGTVLGCLWILCSLLGGAGMAQHVGRGDDHSPAWISSVRGGLFITLTWILPIVGWLGMLPLTLATGLGCLVLGLFPARRTVPAPAPEQVYA